MIAAAAVRLGFAPVFAMDSDPDAVEAATGTARRNGMDFDVTHGDVLADALPEVELVVANIELRAVETLLGAHPAPRAITSGYLASDAPRVDGWRQVSRLELEGWAADLLVASP